jgi:hypothetical protein
MSLSFLALAIALVAYGLYALCHFSWYTGEYFDDRLYLFDNGVYPFMWGVVLLVIALIVRLPHRRLAILVAASTALAIFLWKRATVPSQVAGQKLFPDAELLNSLIAICVVLLCLALADRYVPRLLSAMSKKISRRRHR